MLYPNYNHSFHTNGYPRPLHNPAYYSIYNAPPQQYFFQPEFLQNPNYFYPPYQQPPYQNPCLAQHLQPLNNQFYSQNFQHSPYPSELQPRSNNFEQFDFHLQNWFQTNQLGRDVLSNQNPNNIAMVFSQKLDNFGNVAGVRYEEAITANEAKNGRLEGGKIYLMQNGVIGEVGKLFDPNNQITRVENNVRAITEKAREAYFSNQEYSQHKLTPSNSLTHTEIKPVGTVVDLGNGEMMGYF